LTIDERLEFLLKSTESLHDSVQKNTDQIAALGGRIDALGGRIDALGVRIDTLVHVVEIDAENIRRLANIAEAHEQRLNGLENKS
jgi:chromosome segregation ATPase